jgi:hypothetical protein
MAEPGRGGSGHPATSLGLSAVSARRDSMMNSNCFKVSRASPVSAPTRESARCQQGSVRRVIASRRLVSSLVMKQESDDRTSDIHVKPVSIIGLKSI